LPAEILVCLKQFSTKKTPCAVPPNIYDQSTIATCMLPACLLDCLPFALQILPYFTGQDWLYPSQYYYLPSSFIFHNSCGCEMLGRALSQTPFWVYFTRGAKICTQTHQERGLSPCQFEFIAHTRLP
jgi:hypothetical protein